MNTSTNPTEITDPPRLRLLELARRQNDVAAVEATATQHRKPHLATVHGRRIAADALCAEPDLQIGRAS